MVKRYCDICRKEITKDYCLIKVDTNFEFGIEREHCKQKFVDKVNLTDHKDYELCGNCYTQIELFAVGLKPKE